MEFAKYNAASHALGIYELLENILIHVDELTLICSMRVNRAWRAVIDDSLHLRQRLFISPRSKRQGLEDHPVFGYKLNPFLDWFATQSFLTTEKAGPVSRPLLIGAARLFSFLPHTFQLASKLSRNATASSLNMMLLTSPPVQTIRLGAMNVGGESRSYELDENMLVKTVRASKPEVGVTIADMLYEWSAWFHEAWIGPQGAELIGRKGWVMCFMLGQAGNIYKKGNQLELEFCAMETTRQGMAEDFEREGYEDLRIENDDELMAEWDRLHYAKNAGADWMLVGKHGQDAEMTRLNLLRCKKAMSLEIAGQYPGWPAMAMTSTMAKTRAVQPKKRKNKSKQKKISRKREVPYHVDFADGLDFNRMKLQLS